MMICRFSHTLSYFFFLVIVVFVQVAHAGLAETFLAEYPAAASRLEEAYSHAKIVGTLFYCYPNSADRASELRRDEEFEILRSGGSLRELRTTLQSSDPKWPAGSISASGGDNQKCFDIYKFSKQKPFQFTGFGPNPDFEITSMFSMRPAFAPYCVLELRMVDWLKELRNVVVETTILDRNDVIKVKAEFTGIGGKTWLGEFYFEPKSYALRGSSLTRGSNAYQSRITYTMDNNGPPRVKSIEAWEEHPAGSKDRVKSRGWDIEKVEFVTIPKEQFTLAALGVKDIPVSDEVETTEKATGIPGAITQPAGIATPPGFDASVSDAKSHGWLAHTLDAIPLWAYGLVVVLLITLGAIAHQKYRRHE